MSYRHPTEAEAQILRETEDFFQLSQSPGWKKLCGEMEAMLDKGREGYETNLSCDPQVSHSLRLRISERRSTITAIQNLVNDAVQDRTEVFKQLELEDVNEYPDDSTDPRDDYDQQLPN